MSKDIEYWLKKGGKENVTEDDFEPAHGSRGRTTTKTGATRTRSNTRSGGSTGASEGVTRSGTMTGGGTTMTASSGSFKKIQKLLDNCEGNGDLFSECGCFPYFMVFISLAIGGTLAALTVVIDFKRLPI